MKKHIFDTLCCSNSEKEAVEHMLVKVFVRYMAKAFFMSAHVKNSLTALNSLTAHFEC